MSFRALYVLTTVAFLAVGAIMLIVASGGADMILESAYSDVVTTELEDDFLRKGLFGLGEPSYLANASACEEASVSEAYVTTVMQYHATPRSCDVFVNDAFKYTDRQLRPRCVGECPYEEFDKTFSLGVLDMRQSHEIRVCCNDICIRKELATVCDS